MPLKRSKPKSVKSESRNAGSETLRPTSQNRLGERAGAGPGFESRLCAGLCPGWLAHKLSIFSNANSKTPLLMFKSSYRRLCYQVTNNLPAWANTQVTGLEIKAVAHPKTTSLCQSPPLSGRMPRGPHCCWEQPEVRLVINPLGHLGYSVPLDSVCLGYTDIS